MSLHIGGKKEIAEKKILMILDFGQAVLSPDTAGFLRNCGSKDKNTSDEITKSARKAKSIVVVEKDGKIDLYHSPISSVTLAGRCKNEWTE